MHMLYNSDNFAVVQFDVPGDTPSRPDTERRGGFEIVDKQKRCEIYLDGLLADQFRHAVETLISQSPSEDDVDDFLAGFGGMAQQPVVLH